MIGLDTNVLVRYIMQDDAKQAALATRLIESLSVESPAYLPLVAVVELAWGLGSAYNLDRQQVAGAFVAFLRICCGPRKSWSSARKQCVRLRGHFRPVALISRTA